MGPRLTRAPHQRAALFDHLVSQREERRWNCETERPRGLEVDDQLEARWLLDRQVRRLLAPCRILCTYEAPRRNKLFMLMPYDMRPPAATYSLVW